MSRADFFLTMLILQLVSYTCYHALREDNLNAFVGFSLNDFGAQLSRTTHFGTAR